MKRKLSFLTAITLVCTVFVVGVFALTTPNASYVLAETVAKKITLQIGSPKMTVDGVEQPIDENGTVPIIQNERTLLPIRAVVEAMGGAVEWNGGNSTVTITTNNAENTQAERNPNLAIRVKPEEEHYIFDLSEHVTRTHVYYKTRFGIELAGDLYMAKDADMTQKYPAIVIGAPFGGVKEQGPGVYANQLAQRGFVVLTFDPAYHGYSGGEPRMVGSTALYAEDFSAGVDYLGVQSFVDREKIAAIGICGSGGFALSAATMDTRIKVVVTSVMYDIAGNMNSSSGEARHQRLEQSSRQRWVDFESGKAAYRISYPKEPEAYEPLPESYTTGQEWHNFYATTRGHHPNALGNVTNASSADLMTFPSLTHINEISPRPILFVVGELAHSRTFGDAAYENAAEPKEMYVAPNANHIDLYDDVTKIPFDKIESFLRETFK